MTDDDITSAARQFEESLQAACVQLTKRVFDDVLAFTAQRLGAQQAVARLSAESPASDTTTKQQIVADLLDGMTVDEVKAKYKRFDARSMAAILAHFTRGTYGQPKKP